MEASRGCGLKDADGRVFENGTIVGFCDVPGIFGEAVGGDVFDDAIIVEGFTLAVTRGAGAFADKNGRAIPAQPGALQPLNLTVFFDDFKEMNAVINRPESLFIKVPGCEFIEG